MPNTPQQQLIVDSFRSETYVQNRMDVQHTPLWDTVTYAAAATITTNTSAFFTNVGPAAGKTLAGTNMTTGNRLDAPQAFSIMGIRFRWAENILLADLNSILAGFALNFVLGQKSYNQGPLYYYNSGGGIDGFTTRSDSSVYTNGQPSRAAAHTIAIPIVIENQMNFSAELVGANFVLAAAGAGGTGAVFQLLLDGLYARGVQ